MIFVSQREEKPNRDVRMKRDKGTNKLTETVDTDLDDHSDRLDRALKV